MPPRLHRLLNCHKQRSHTLATLGNSSCRGGTPHAGSGKA